MGSSVRTDALRWRLPRMVAAPAVPQTLVACDPRPWLSRDDGECAYPVSGHGAAVKSCCQPCPGQTYCPPHRAAMLRPPPTNEVPERKSHAQAVEPDVRSLFQLPGRGR